jgi:hypothetical protein
MAAASTVKMLTTDMGIDELRAFNRKIVNDTRKEQTPVWSNYMRKETTNEYFQEYFEFGGFGLVPKKDEGDYLNFATPDIGDLARITPEGRQLAFAITREDKKFNRIDKVGRATKMLARAARKTVEMVAAFPLNVGFAVSAVRFTMDGEALFSAGHILLDGTTFSNLGTASDLNIAALEARIVQFTVARDNDGTFINLKPKYLVVAPAGAPNARRVLRATNYWTTTGATTSVVDTTADRGIPNATVQDAGLILVVNPYLTDANAWFLIADKSEHELVLIENEAFNDRSFIDPYTEDYVYSVRFANIAAAPHWMGLDGSAGAT